MADAHHPSAPRTLRQDACAAAAGRSPTCAPLARPDESRRILDDGRERIAPAAARDVDIGPADEWLLDSYHVVQEHVREVRESLPRGYYRELRELAAGPLAGHPRRHQCRPKC